MTSSFEFKMTYTATATLLFFFEKLTSTPPKDKLSFPSFEQRKWVIDDFIQESLLLLLLRTVNDDSPDRELSLMTFLSFISGSGFIITVDLFIYDIQHKGKLSKFHQCKTEGKCF